MAKNSLHYRINRSNLSVLLHITVSSTSEEMISTNKTLYHASNLHGVAYRIFGTKTYTETDTNTTTTTCTEKIYGNSLVLIQTKFDLCNF